MPIARLITGLTLLKSQDGSIRAAERQLCADRLCIGSCVCALADYCTQLVLRQTVPTTSHSVAQFNRSAVCRSRSSRQHSWQIRRIRSTYPPDTSGFHVSDGYAWDTENKLPTDPGSRSIPDPDRYLDRSRILIDSTVHSLSLQLSQSSLTPVSAADRHLSALSPVTVTDSLARRDSLFGSCDNVSCGPTQRPVVDSLLATQLRRFSSHTALTAADYCSLRLSVCIS